MLWSAPVNVVPIMGSLFVKTSYISPFNYKKVDRFILRLLTNCFNQVTFLTEFAEVAQW